MRLRIAVACTAVMLLALACQAGAVTAYIDTFNGAYVGGPTGPIPTGWTYFGYGPPSFTTQETGLVLPPNDGTNSATRWTVPGIVASGTIALYKTGVSLDTLALPGQPINWAYPVNLKIDCYGLDLGIGTKWETLLDLQGVTRTAGIVEWGDNGIQNEQWITIETPVAAGQSGKSGTLLFMLNFDFTGKTFGANDVVIWDNLRMDYTAVPEPSSILALAAGMIGLGGLIRRKR